MAEIGAQPDNQNAAKGLEWAQAIKRALARRGEGDYRRGLDLLADRLVKTGAEGDETAALKAIESVGDRFDGRPTQITQLSGPDGGPVQVQAIEISLVKPEQP